MSQRLRIDVGSQCPQIEKLHLDGNSSTEGDRALQLAFDPLGSRRPSVWYGPRLYLLQDCTQRQRLPTSKCVAFLWRRVISCGQRRALGSALPVEVQERVTWLKRLCAYLYVWVFVYALSAKWLFGRPWEGNFFLDLCLQTRKGSVHFHVEKVTYNSELGRIVGVKHIWTFFSGFQ